MLILARVMVVPLHAACVTGGSIVDPPKTELLKFPSGHDVTTPHPSPSVIPPGLVHLSPAPCVFCLLASSGRFCHKWTPDLRQCEGAVLGGVMVVVQRRWLVVCSRKNGSFLSCAAFHLLLNSLKIQAVDISTKCVECDSPRCSTNGLVCL